MKLRTMCLSGVIVLVAAYLYADDGAASIGAGGIVAMKREPRIVMAKEVLQISWSKVVVDYDFRNDSDEEITTEMAFPIPDYEWELDRTGSEQGFEDFKLWVNGAPKKYEIEARAFLNDKEYTDLLKGLRVDIASFGHPTRDSLQGRDVRRLTAAQRSELQRLGLVDVKGEGVALWRVQKKYHWRQTFPARKTIHIRHEYTPNAGSMNNVSYGMSADADKESADEIKSFCIAGPVERILKRVIASDDREASYVYVDFILTTANTWKTPIEDFTLMVERSHWKDWKTGKDLGNYVSFCWDGSVTKVDADHFQAHVQNLVPTKELRVGFFQVETRRVP